MLTMPIPSDTTSIENIKLYSQRSISIATYFGGPLAAGILARQNYVNLGKEQAGMYSLVIGTLSTLLLFAGIFSVPEDIMDKIPSALIPFVYTGIIYLIIEKYQGAILKSHKENKRPFYSAWRATGIGGICMVILLAGIFGYAYLAPESFDTKKYDDGIAQFNVNEEKALQLFTLLDKGNKEEIISHIDQIGIPSWQQNLTILTNLDKIEGLEKQFITQNEILRKYTLLRISYFELIRKAVDENTVKYDAQLQKINSDIEAELKKL
jgi:hypothetical protein